MSSFPYGYGHPPLVALPERRVFLYPQPFDVQSNTVPTELAPILGNLVCDCKMNYSPFHPRTWGSRWSKRISNSFLIPYLAPPACPGYMELRDFVIFELRKKNWKVGQQLLPQTYGTLGFCHFSTQEEKLERRSTNLPPSNPTPPTGHMELWDFVILELRNKSWKLGWGP